MTSIRTERLLLRPARPDDAEAMFEILSDPEAMRYWSTQPHESVDRTRDWIARMIASHAKGWHGDFLVEHEGRLVGNAGYSHAPEVGFIIRRDCWGRGFGREAASAAIAYGFETLDLPAVTADVDPRNAASLALLESLGFARTGFAERTFYVGGQWANSLYLTLERVVSQFEFRL
jgi:ribosomal-protein-alanine N-acetyltransferase